VSGRIARKWRPSLALVLGLTVAALLCLPVAGLIGLRWLGPMLGWGRAMAILALVVLLSAGLVAWVLWRILLRPITTLAARADAVVQRQPGALDPLPHYGTAEMGRLGAVVIGMGAVLTARETALRTYADHASHELKSPLTAIRGAAELLRGADLAAPDRDRLLSRIDEATDRMTALLAAQQAFARAQDPRFQGRSSLSGMLSHLAARHPALQLTLEGDAHLPLSAEGMDLVLDHLLGNAAALGATAVRLTGTGSGLTVADNGPGISTGNRDRIFDAFFTTRRADGGTGMGLAICRRLIEAHGGRITLEDQASPGARFRIDFADPDQVSTFSFR
jgi:signal transduction histidine kinase